MKRVTKVRFNMIVVSLVCAFSMAAFANAEVLASTSAKLKAQYQDQLKQCQFNPDECTFNALGAGNGGGNEPPYTPRKPKKKAKPPTP